MSTISLDFLSRKSVLERVHLWLSYFGGKRKDNLEDFDRVVSQGADEGLLKGYYETGIAELRLTYGARYEELLGKEGESADVTIRRDGVRSLMREWLGAKITADWLFIVGEEEAAGQLRKIMTQHVAVLEEALPPLPTPEAARHKLSSPRRIPHI